jgi:UPF0716 protein FxsA
MFLALALLVAWPVAEIFVAITLAEAIGVLPMVILLIAGMPLGRWVLRSEGRAAWRRLSEAVSSGRQPGREALEGALVVAGGVLMIVPGFIGDLVGACLLLPPTRRALRAVLSRNVRSRLVLRAAQFARPGRSATPSYDVDSTATDVEAPRLRP